MAIVRNTTTKRTLAYYRQTTAAGASDTNMAIFFSIGSYGLDGNRQKA